MKLIFLGPPGAGKGTMAKRLSEELSIPHISTGDIIRGAIRNETDLGKKVKTIVETGGLVPDDLTIALVEKRLAEDDAKEGYILDGFPRTITQADTLSDFQTINMVVNFELKDDKIIQRLLGRRIHKASGRTYNILFNPPKVEGRDDETGEELVIRPDDEKEAITRRLDIYRRQTEPLIKYYTQKALLTDLDSSPAPDEVFSQLKKAVITW